MTVYKNPKATTGAIIEKDGKLLLIKRTIEPFKDHWCMPGGHIELGERPSETIKREVMEEVGLDFEPKFYHYFNEIFPEFDWYAVALFFTGSFEGEVKMGEETSEYQWATPEEALKLELSFVNREVIESWIAHKREEVTA